MKVRLVYMRKLNLKTYINSCIEKGYVYMDTDGALYTDNNVLQSQKDEFISALKDNRISIDTSFEEFKKANDITDLKELKVLLNELFGKENGEDKDAEHKSDNEDNRGNKANSDKLDTKGSSTRNKGRKSI